MVPKTSESKNENWFEKLESNLNKKKEEVQKGYSLESDKKKEINQDLAQDLWRILLKFGDINIHFTLEPSATVWASFQDYPTVWKLRDEYNFGTVNSLLFSDTTREDNRTGDSLAIEYINTPEGEKLRISFVFFEGEKYYKYSGWKRSYRKNIVYEDLLSHASITDIHNVFTDVVTKWYESHLKRDRNVIIDHIKEKYPKGENFAE